MHVNEVKAKPVAPLPPIQCACSPLSSCTQSCPCAASSTPLFLPNSPNKLLNKVPGMLVKGCKASCSCKKGTCGFSFLARTHPKLVVIRRSAGSLRPFWSLATLQKLDKGEFVLEVTGEVIDAKESSNPLLTAPLCAQLSLSMVSQGSLARFLQHSCDPTLSIVRFCPSSDLRLTRLLLFAQKSLSKCEELTVDFDCLLGLHGRISCLCGSALCRGHIGVD